MSIEHLNRAKKKLIDERPDMQTYQDYYDGDQPMVYSAERLREVFGNSTLSEFIENWCAVVVDTALDRIMFKGWRSDNKATRSALEDFYNAQDLKVVSREIHKDAMVTNHGYAIFDEIEPGKRRLIRNSPMNVTCVYSESDPAIMEYAFKMWLEPGAGEKGEDIIRANLYYPDVIEKYQAIGKNESNAQFELLSEGGEQQNGFGRIPVVHFQPAVLELKNIVTLQDSVNKIFSDMMVTGEFNAFRQRWAVTNANIDDLKASPQSIWRFPKGMSEEEQTKVGEFSPAELKMFVEVMQSLAEAIAIISRTPKNYLMSTGANLSGEALHVTEAPLVRKVQQQTEKFSKRWEDVAHFVVEDDNITTVWDKAETKLLTQDVKVMERMVDIGIPLPIVLSKFGWSNSDIEQVQEAQKQEAEQEAEQAAEVLRLARLRAERDNDPTL